MLLEIAKLAVPVKSVILQLSRNRNITHVYTVGGSRSSYTEKKQPYLYMKVSLTIDGEDVGQLTPVQYKYLIMQALKETLGQIGASYTVDLLKLSSNGVALLRLPTGYSDKLWTALTMYGATPAKRRCAFRVLQVSPFLMGLVVDSRWQQ